MDEIGIGCDEHYLVHTLRQSEDFIPELNFVLEIDGKTISHIIYSKGKVVTPNGEEHEVLNFGPISVLPEYQKAGYGSKIMVHSLNEAKRLGYEAVLFFGHPTYYPRFGFVEASDFGITTKDGYNYPAFMAMELKEGALKGLEGKYYESSLYEVNKEEACAYDKAYFQK